MPESKHKGYCMTLRSNRKEEVESGSSNKHSWEWELQQTQWCCILIILLFALKLLFVPVQVKSLFYNCTYLDFSNVKLDGSYCLPSIINSLSRRLIYSAKCTFVALLACTKAFNWNSSAQVLPRTHPICICKTLHNEEIKTDHWLYRVLSLALS